LVLFHEIFGVQNHEGHDFPVSSIWVASNSEGTIPLRSLRIFSSSISWFVDAK
jgi:hypothetical protein